MSYYIGFTYNDGGRDVARLSEAQVAEAVAVQIDRTVRDALALYILRHIGLSSVSGIRSIDMVRKVADGDGDDSATETARYGIIGPQTALDTHKPLKTPPSLINALSNG